MGYKEYLKGFVEERNKAFTAFVMEDDVKAFKAFTRKYGGHIPKDETIMAAGIYKAVQYCTGIPDEVKKTAARKCLELGFSPYIDFDGLLQI